MSAGAHAFFHDLLALLFRVLDRVRLDEYINRLSWAHAPIMTIGLIAFTFSRGCDDSTRGAWRALGAGALAALSLSLVSSAGIHFTHAQLRFRALNIVTIGSALLHALILRWFARANRLCGAPPPLPCFTAPTASLARGNRRPLFVHCPFVRFARSTRFPFNHTFFRRRPLRLLRAWAGVVSFPNPSHVPGGLLCAFTYA